MFIVGCCLRTEEYKYSKNWEPACRNCKVSFFNRNASLGLHLLYWLRTEVGWLKLRRRIGTHFLTITIVVEMIMLTKNFFQIWKNTRCGFEIWVHIHTIQTSLPLRSQDGIKFAQPCHTIRHVFLEKNRYIL